LPYRAPAADFVAAVEIACPRQGGGAGRGACRRPWTFPGAGPFESRGPLSRRHGRREASSMAGA